MPTLSIVKEPIQHSPSLSHMERIEQTLAKAKQPLSRIQLRQECKMRTISLGQTLAQMIQEGRVIKTKEGFILPQQKT